METHSNTPSPQNTRLSNSVELTNFDTDLRLFTSADQSCAALADADGNLLSHSAVAAIIDALRSFYEQTDAALIDSYNTLWQEVRGRAAASEASQENLWAAQAVARKTAAKAGYVYLLSALTGHYKIGRSVHVPTRSTAISMQMPFPVTILHTIPVSNMAWAERQLHDRFQDCRVHGEWFALSREHVQWIQGLRHLEPNTRVS